jgi:hypothetical protein
VRSNQTTTSDGQRDTSTVAAVSYKNPRLDDLKNWTA